MISRRRLLILASIALRVVSIEAVAFDDLETGDTVEWSSASGVMP